jgi:hypothetical protein
MEEREEGGDSNMEAWGMAAWEREKGRGHYKQSLQFGKYEKHFY